MFIFRSQSEQSFKCLCTRISSAETHFLKTDSLSDSRLYVTFSVRSLPYHHIFKKFLFILAGWVFVVVHGLSLVAVTVGYSLLLSSCFPGGSDGKEPTCNEGRPGFNPWLGKKPWRREQLPTPVFWPREFHGHGRLAGYSPWGCRVGYD